VFLGELPSVEQLETSQSRLKDMPEGLLGVYTVAYGTPECLVQSLIDEDIFRVEEAALS